MSFVFQGHLYHSAPWHSVDLGQAGQRGQLVIAEDRGPAHRQARDVRGFIPFLRPIRLLRSFFTRRLGPVRCAVRDLRSLPRNAWHSRARIDRDSIRRAIPFRRGNAITHALGTDRIVGRGDLRDQLPAGSGTTSVSVPPNLPARRDPSTSCKRSRWPLRRSQAGDAPGHGVLCSPDRGAASESAIIRARQVAAWEKRAKVTAVVTEWVGINDMADHRGLPVAIRPPGTRFGLGRRTGTRPPGAFSKKKRHLFRPFCVGVRRRLPVVRAGVARLPKLRQAGQFGAGRVATA